MTMKYLGEKKIQRGDDKASVVPTKGLHGLFNSLGRLLIIYYHSQFSVLNKADVITVQFYLQAFGELGILLQHWPSWA